MPIEGFSKYHICKNGRLYSIHSGTWRLIKPVAKSTGYISNNLISDSGKRVNFYRHRLVAEVYLPNNDNTLVVCHKDNNPLNNHYKNLYWGTPKENAQQCIRDGRFHFNSGWNAFSDRKKYRIYRFMLRHPDYTANEIAKKFSTGRCMVFKIKKKYGS